jgi:hypothetical protein
MGTFLKSSALYIIIISILIGTFLICFGIWGEFDDTKWNETWSSLGKVILGSGIFAGILKIMQITGVFKDELEQLIFEPKFLGNRKDLKLYWEKVSKELFENKLPKISRKILNDLSTQYLLTNELVYYDEQEHFINLIFNPSSGKLRVTQKITLSIISQTTDSIKYEFSSSINYVRNPLEVDYKCTKLKINGNDFKDFKVYSEVAPKRVNHKHVLTLSGMHKYDLVREESKEYLIEEDDYLYFTSQRIAHTLKVTINNSDNLLIDFMKVGELHSFIEKINTETHQQHEYKNVIYKEQGYFVKVNVKKDEKSTN